MKEEEIKRIKITRSYLWGNTRSSIDYYHAYGHFSIVIKGLCLDILINKKKYMKYVDSLIKLGQSKSSACFPFVLK